MKKKSKFLIIGMASMIFTAYAISTNALSLDLNYEKISNDSKDGDAEMIRAFGENYDEFLEENWNKAMIATRLDSFIKKYYDNSYPSYYGGMYISDDAQNLIIQIVEKNIPKETTQDYKKYIDIINMDNSIKVEFVENSYNELEEINNKIITYFTSDNIDEIEKHNLVSTSIDIMNNMVEVKLKEITDDKQERFMEIVLYDTQKHNMKNSNEIKDYSKYISFEKGEPFKPAINLNAGGNIKTDLGSCSMGYRVKYNNQNGYLTAGHCVSKTKINIPTGTVVDRQFNNNQANDYAFVATNSSYTPTNNLQYTASGYTKLAVAHYCPVVVVNMAVAKSGASTKYTTGVITNIDMAVNYEEFGIKVTNLVLVGNTSVNCGDSGGAVFIPKTDSNGGSVPIGILSGGNQSDDCSKNGNLYAFTNINRLPSALQTGRY